MSVTKFLQILTVMACVIFAVAADSGEIADSMAKTIEQIASDCSSTQLREAIGKVALAFVRICSVNAYYDQGR